MNSEEALKVLHAQGASNETATKQLRKPSKGPTFGSFYCPVLASLNDDVFASHAQYAFDNYVDQTLETAAAAQLRELTF
jgi:hypothetical protein